MRLCLLLVLVTALGGVWAVEQPENSVLEFFPPFTAVLGNLFETQQITAAARRRKSFHFLGLGVWLKIADTQHIDDLTWEDPISIYICGFSFRF